MPKFYPQEVGTPLTLTIQSDFSAGQFSDYAPTKIPETGVSAAQNCVLNRVGEIETRPGYVLKDTTVEADHIDEIAGLNNDTVQAAIVFGGAGIYSFDGTTLTDIGGYSYNSGESQLMAVQSGNKIYCVDGTNRLRFYDGTAWDENVAPDVHPLAAGAEIIIAHDKKLIVAGEALGKETIQVSDIHLDTVPEFDTSVWSFEVANDGTKITAMASWFDQYFAVFKRNKTYVVDAVRNATTAAGYTIDVADQNIGCVAKKSALAVNGDVFFLSDSGVHKLMLASDGSQYRVTPSLSKPIDNLIRNIRKDKVSQSHAKQRGDKYILYIPVNGIMVNGVEQSSDTCNCAVVWNTTLNGSVGGWEGYWVGENVSAMDVVEIGDYSYHIVGSEDGSVYVSSDYKNEEDKTASDYSLATEIETRGFNFNEEHGEKRPRHIELYCMHSLNGSESVSIYSSVDGGEYTPVRTVDVSTGSGLVLPFTFPIIFDTGRFEPFKVGLAGTGRFRDIRIKVRCNSGKLSVRSIGVAAFNKTMKKDSSDAS